MRKYNIKEEEVQEQFVQVLHDKLEKLNKLSRKLNVQKQKIDKEAQSISDDIRKFTRHSFDKYEHKWVRMFIPITDEIRERAKKHNIYLSETDDALKEYFYYIEKVNVDDYNRVRFSGWKFGENDEEDWFSSSELIGGLIYSDYINMECCYGDLSIEVAQEDKIRELLNLSVSEMSEALQKTLEGNDLSDKRGENKRRIIAIEKRRKNAENIAKLLGDEEEFESAFASDADDDEVDVDVDDDDYGELCEEILDDAYEGESELSEEESE